MIKIDKEKILAEAVLCFIIDISKRCVLLYIKKKKIGKGKRNGLGGGIESGETQRMACVREVGEEGGGISVKVENLIKMGDAYFDNTTEDGKNFICHVSIFISYIWEGLPSDTEEMGDPKWFSLDNLPKNDMMPADPVWLPIILSGKKAIIKAKYGPRQASLIGTVETEEVEVLTEG
jgi:8-oxo-dGTP diphosphatase